MPHSLAAANMTRPLNRDGRFHSFVDVVRHRAQTSADHLALYALHAMREPQRHYTYAELDRRVRAIAARLQRAGAFRERALLVLHNDPDYLLAFLACAYAGVTAVTLIVPAGKKHADRLALIARDCDARFLITTGALARQFRDAVATEGATALTWIAIDEIPDDLAPQWDPHAPQPDDLAYLQYTSGSTGQPRGVMITHGNLIFQGEYLEKCFSFTPADRGLSWLPLFHDMGLILGALQPIFTGFPLALATPGAFIKNPERWLAAIAKLEITFTGGPNFIYDLAVDSVDRAKLPADLDLSCWRVALNAAEPVRATTIARFQEAYGPSGFRAETMNPGYGLAETTLAVSVKPRGTPVVTRAVCADALAADRITAPVEPGRARILVSSGRFYPDVVVRIVDTVTLSVRGIDEVGEIWVAGATIGQGYWRQPAASAETFGAVLEGDSRPYLRTGDLGFVDADGNLFITGRIKDLLIVAGKNHYPQDIELTVEQANEAFRPHCCAAVTLDDGERERLVVLAEVQRKHTATFDPAALARQVAMQVSRQHEITVDEIVFLQHGQVPKTTSGKVRRTRCRELYLADAFLTHGRVRLSFGETL